MDETSYALNQTSAFWRNFYVTHSLRNNASPFAQWCLEHHLSAASSILELGCGDGRDSFAFINSGLPVLALDACKVAIDDNKAHQCMQTLPAEGQFLEVDFLHLDTLAERAKNSLECVNTVYSRFVLHAIPETLEDKILDFCHRILPVGGRMMHEFRTIRDPLMQQGVVLSPTERLTDHYRRFLDPDVFRAKLAERGWGDVFFVEQSGLAKFRDDDPIVARIVVKKLGR